MRKYTPEQKLAADQAREEQIKTNDPRHCPGCGGLGKRTNSKSGVKGFLRRRKCLSCGWRWSTTEIDSDRIKIITKLEQAFGRVFMEMREHSPGMRVEGLDPPPRIEFDDTRSVLPNREPVKDDSDA